MKRAGGFRYDWEPDIWSWMPDLEPWSLRHGVAPFPAFLEVSTEDVVSHEAYDFWREAVFYNFDADRRSPDDAQAFEGVGRVILTPDVKFFSYRSDGVSGGRTRRHISSDERDSIELGLVLAGCRRCRREDDNAGVVEPGDFFFYDEAVPSRVVWDAHSGVHLSLQRGAVETALGDRMSDVGKVAHALGQSRVAPMLRSQFTFLARHMEGLDPGERGFLLNQTAELALYAIGRLGFARSRGEQERTALFAAAQRYIERHFADFDLNADRLAVALGTSRATLYRAFADRGATVTGTIRSMRLARARRMLEEAPAHISVSDIAGRSGFAEMRTFHRAFRDRFAMSPGEARYEAALDPPVAGSVS